MCSGSESICSSLKTFLQFVVEALEILRRSLGRKRRQRRLRRRSSIWNTRVLVSRGHDELPQIQAGRGTARPKCSVKCGGEKIVFHGVRVVNEKCNGITQVPQFLALLSSIRAMRGILFERIKGEYSLRDFPLNVVFSWVSMVLSSRVPRHFGGNCRLLARNVLSPKEVGNGESDTWLNGDR